MDYAQDLLALANNHLTPTQLSTAFKLLTTVRAYTTTALSYTSTLLTNNPTLGTIALFLVIILVSLKILNMAINAVKFWFNLLVTVGLYGGAIVLGTWFFARGPEGVMHDVMALTEWGWGHAKGFQRNAEFERKVKTGKAIKNGGWF